jgi:hypothetical protein
MTIFAGVGSPGSVGPTSGGKIYPYNNLGTTPQVVAQANPFRTGITFHNPGTVDIVVFPSVVQGNGTTAPTTPTNVSLTPTTSALGGGFRIYANGGQLTLTGECQGAWQALSVSSSNNPFTVMESNT